MNTPSGRLSAAPRVAAFTLIELLTVIAIIGILAAIIVPVVSKARAHAYRAQGLSQIRDLTNATLLYCNDSRGNKLPGPLYSGHTLEFRVNKPAYLFTHLVAYMNGPAATYENKELTQILTSAQRPWYEEMKAAGQTPVVFTTPPYRNESNSEVWPFGLDGSSTPTSLSSMSSVVVHESSPVRKPIMFLETDQKSIWVKNRSWAQRTPATPLHGGSRIASFYDGSARVLSAAESE